MYDHCRYGYFQLPATGGMQTLGQAIFYPQYCRAMHHTQMYKVKLMAAILLNVIRKLQGEQNCRYGHNDKALERLAQIFETGVQDKNVPFTPSSSNPTAPAKLDAAPKVYLKWTHNNIPGIITMSWGE